MSIIFRYRKKSIFFLEVYNMEGWIKLYRKIAENPLWTAEKFSRGQAWVDLLLLASHKDNYFYKRGIKINIARGQVGVSELGLAARWQWSRGKVRKFLTDLQDEQQISIEKNNITQIITITNYKEYQKNGQQKEQQNNTKKININNELGGIQYSKIDNKQYSEMTPDDTTERHQNDTIKNDKNVKNDKNNTNAPNDKKHRSEPKPQITFNFETNEFENITDKDIEIWKKAYPAVDINLTLNQIAAWLAANPNKRKKNYKRFITNWLTREQDKGGSLKAVSNVKTFAEIEEEREKEKIERLKRKWEGA